MIFPENWKDFLGDYCFEDREKIYTNGSQLIPVFRVVQMVEHYFLEKAPPRKGENNE